MTNKEIVLVRDLDTFIKKLGYNPDQLVFLSDSQDVSEVKLWVKSARHYDSFFVINGDSEYIFIAGVEGIVPDNSKHAVILLQ